MGNKGFKEYEIRRLLKQYHNGSQEAYELLVNGHQKIVSDIATSYQQDGLLLEDLIQEGNLGLIKAINYYDYKHYYDFSNYAKDWITCAILVSIIENYQTIKVPVEQYLIIKKIQQFVDNFKKENGYLPSINDIELGDETEPKEIEYLYNISHIIDHNTGTIEELVNYESNLSSPDDKLLKESRSFDIEQLLSQLSERSADIIRLYYGITPYSKARPLKKIAKIYGLTRERIRQLRIAAIRDLREIILTKGKRKEKADNEVNNNSRDKNRERRKRKNNQSLIENQESDLKQPSHNNPQEKIVIAQSKHKARKKRIIHKVETKKEKASGDFIIENVRTFCKLLNNKKEVVYFAIGKIVKSDNVYYHVLYTSNAFFVNTIDKKTTNRYVTGRSIIVANKKSDLYKTLNENTYFEHIEKIVGENDSTYVIRVLGLWYDQDGECINNLNT
jgi:RNA polymerase primary sigma factor